MTPISKNKMAHQRRSNSIIFMSKPKQAHRSRSKRSLLTINRSQNLIGEPLTTFLWVQKSICNNPTHSKYSRGCKQDAQSCGPLRQSWLQTATALNKSLVGRALEKTGQIVRGRILSHLANS